MCKCRVNDLKPYANENDSMKTNSYYFDDITGATWDAFKSSIANEGVLEPIMVTEGTNRIVSGHQRWRACSELNIEDVPVRYVGEQLQKIVLDEDGNEQYVDDEDKILLYLIETNLKQRGNANPNPVKMGRCIKALERLYGIRNGSANKKGTVIIRDPNNLGDENKEDHRDPNNSGDVTNQSDLAARMGMSVDTLSNYKKLADLPGEVGSYIVDGIIKATTALYLRKKLSPEKIVMFLSSLDKERKYSGSEIKKMIEPGDVEQVNTPAEEIPSEDASAENASAIVAEETPAEEVVTNIPTASVANDPIDNYDRLPWESDEEYRERKIEEKSAGTAEIKEEPVASNQESILPSLSEIAAMHKDDDPRDSKIRELTLEVEGLRSHYDEIMGKYQAAKREIEELKSKLLKYEINSFEKPVEDAADAGNTAENTGLTKEQNDIRNRILMLDKAGQDAVRKFMGSAKLKTMDHSQLKMLKTFVSQQLKNHKAV